MSANDLELKARSYLDAFEARDLVGCVDHFADQATLLFQTTTFCGKKQIEQWHRERFHADARLVRVNGIAADGDTVKINGVITSKRLRAWLINEFPGAMILRFEGDKIQDVKFAWNF